MAMPIAAVEELTKPAPRRGDKDYIPDPGDKDEQQ